MSYAWTDDACEIDALLPLADAIEIAGCTDDGTNVERINDATMANFFAVYLHFTPGWDRDPTGAAGAICIADRDTLAEARQFAGSLAMVARAATPLTINDFTGAV